MTSPRVDLGSGHSLTWYSRLGSDEKAGIIVCHPLRPGDLTCAWRGECCGAVTFDIPINADYTRDKWQVVALEPLTLTPSLACHCGDHGFIRDGRWQPA